MGFQGAGTLAELSNGGAASEGDDGENDGENDGGEEGGDDGEYDGEDGWADREYEWNNDEDEWDEGGSAASRAFGEVVDTNEGGEGEDVSDVVGAYLLSTHHPRY